MKYKHLIILMLALLFVFSCSEEENDEEDSIPFDSSPRWSKLHGDNANTDSVATDGLKSDPVVLWEIVDDSPSPFSGPVIGPGHERSFGVGNKIYRVLGPGPISFDPPDGIDMVIGLESAVQVINPNNGKILNERSFNPGTFTNFTTVDADGNVYVPDWGRLQKFSGGLTEVLWRFDYGGLLGGFGEVPAASVVILPGGDVLLPLLSGKLMVLDDYSGELLDEYDMSILNPPIEPDPQFAWAGILFRNAVAADGNELFCLVNGEMLRFKYDPNFKELKQTERSPSFGFSSSTPTLDTQGKRLFIVTFDPDFPDDPPQLRCFDYSTRPMTLRWSIATNVDFTESEDQLTTTYLAEQGVIINNSLYGNLSAYREVEGVDGPEAELLWTTNDILDGPVGAYISAATQPDGTIYFVENFSRTLFGMDGLTGQVLWTYELPAQSIKTPIPHNGRLFVDHNYGMVALY